MSKNVVLWDGRVVTVDDDTAEATVRNGMGAHEESAPESTGRAVATHEADIHANAPMKGVNNLFDVLTSGPAALLYGKESSDQAISGAADTLTGGGFGKLKDAFTDEDTLSEVRAQRQAHGTARFVGSTAALALNPGGVLGEGGAAASAFGKWGGRIAEGAAVGLDGYVSDSNVTGDDLTIEGAFHSAGVGAVFNTGISAAGDALGALGNKMRKGAAAAEELRGHVDLAEKGSKLLGDEQPPAYGEFQDAHKAGQAELSKVNGKAAKASADYATYAADDNAMAGALKGTETARNEILTRLNATPEAQATELATEADKAALKSYQADTKKFTDYTSSTEKFPRDIAKADKAIETIADRYGITGDAGETALPSKAPSSVRQGFADAVHEAGEKASEGRYSGKAFISDVYKNLDPSYKFTDVDQFKQALMSSHMLGDVSLSRADLSAAFDPNTVADSLLTHSSGAEFHFVNAPGMEAAPAASETGSMADRVKELKQLRSRIGKQLRGGYTMESSKWVRDPTIPADPIGAMTDFHELRARIGSLKEFAGKGFPDISFPDLVKIPERPAGTAGLMAKADEVHAGLSQAARDVRTHLDNARSNMSNGMRTTAMEDLRQAALGARAAGLHDIAFPKLPEPGGAVGGSTLPGHLRTLPKTLQGLVRMSPESISQIAGSLTPESETAVFKLAKSLGMETKPTAAATLADMHAALGKYTTAMDKVSAVAEKTGKQTSWMDKPRKLMKKAMSMSAASAVASTVGGPLGAGAWYLTNGVANKVLAGSEASADAAFAQKTSALLVADRSALKNRARDLVAKYVDGKGMGKLAAITANLSTSWPAGASDPSKDVREKARNRAYEIASMSAHVGDTLFNSVDHLMGHQMDIGGKLHDKGMAIHQYLNYTAPKDPGLDHIGLGTSSWLPSYPDSIALGARLEAIKTPDAAVSRILSGDGHPAGVEALWTIWPAYMQEVRSEMMMNPPATTYEEGGNYSMLLRQPYTSLQEPVISAALQGLYQLKPPSTGGPSSSPGSSASPLASTPNPGGRPAAVSSPVAGSSVSALTR